MMSEEATAKLRELQARIAADAENVRTRQEYITLAGYFKDISEVLDNGSSTV